MKWIIPAVAALLTLASAPAWATDGQDVGFGVAAGIDYSQADMIFEDDSNTSFAWGFFVDIPLAETFVLSPQTTIYELDFGSGNQAITDVGMNFKFVIPLRSLSLGAGILAGVTTGLGEYRLHYGALGQLNFNLISNIDGFVLAQFKRIDVGDDFMNEDISKVHAFAGAMFRF
ncbi:MAG: hypothetical protein AAF654_02825 [Myxococcota bacterium]